MYAFTNHNGLYVGLLSVIYIGDLIERSPISIKRYYENSIYIKLYDLVFSIVYFTNTIYNEEVQPCLLRENTTPKHTTRFPRRDDQLREGYIFMCYAFWLGWTGPIPQNFAQASSHVMVTRRRLRVANL